MKNLEIAKIFYDIADMLELQGVQWKPVAYRKAARALEALPEDVEAVYEDGGLKALERIPGVGEKLAEKIVQYIKEGKIHEFERLKNKIPRGLAEMIQVPGLGPKKAVLLYKKLKIKSIDDLEKAAKEHKICHLETFREKSEENILRGIKLFKAGEERKPLAIVLPVAEEIASELQKLKGVGQVAIGGSLRRMRETVKDIDILVTSRKPAAVMDYFIRLPAVKSVLGKGDTKASVILANNLQVDVRVVPEKSFGAAMQYFTGSKDHNVELRKIAIEKGLKLSEYGLFRGDKIVAGASEAEIYKKLGMQWIEPELRENTGEINAAIEGKLPNLVTLSNIRGDLHTHSRWSDGSSSIEEMANAAKALGYEYICITDHSKSEHIANGLTEERLIERMKEIKEARRKVKGIAILAGAEVDILPNGSLDYSDDVLAGMDIVVAAVHSRFGMGKKEMTMRIVNAIANENVDIIGHPTGRMLGSREPYELDMDAVMKAAADYGKVLEVNGAPERMDLRDAHVRLAVENGVKLAINTDAHSIDQLRQMVLGVASARRGWAEKTDVLNAMVLGDIIKRFKIKI